MVHILVDSRHIMIGPTVPGWSPPGVRRQEAREAPVEIHFHHQPRLPLHQVIQYGSFMCGAFGGWPWGKQQHQQQQQQQKVHVVR